MPIRHSYAGGLWRHYFWHVGGHKAEAFAVSSLNLLRSGYARGAQVTSSLKRTCGDCTLSCKVMAIEALAKPASAWCSHCRPSHGCAIYPERPTECEDFACLWLVN